MKYIIYGRYNKITGLWYIGKTSKTLEERAGINGSKYLIRKKDGTFKHYKLAKAILEYGWDSFESIILKEVDCDLNEINELEKQFIKEKDSFHNGYNGTEGRRRNNIIWKR